MHRNTKDEKKNKLNNSPVAAKQRWSRYWESLEMACVDHAPTPEDLSPSANATNGRGPPTAEVGEGRKLDRSLYAQARARHAPMCGSLGESLLASMESEDDSETDGEARVL
jgi:hypothetical protein